jgi:hypothetical protein
MSHRRFGLGRTLLLIVFIGTAATMAARAFIPHAEPARLFDKETKLKVHDRKIVSIAAEFTRRSSKLRDVIKELAACNPRCPTELTVKFDRSGAPVTGPSGKYGWAWRLPKPQWTWQDLECIKPRTLRLF